MRITGFSAALKGREGMPNHTTAMFSKIGLIDGTIRTVSPNKAVIRYAEEPLARLLNSDRLRQHYFATPFGFHPR
jgi:hypothetical protein